MDSVREKDRVIGYLLMCCFLCVLGGFVIGKAWSLAQTMQEPAPNVVNLAIHQYYQIQSSIKSKTPIKNSSKSKILLLLFVVAAVIGLRRSAPSNRHREREPVNCTCMARHQKHYG